MLKHVVIVTGILIVVQGNQDCVELYPNDWRGIYNGTRTTTVTGKMCHVWTDNNPEQTNYCRTPNKDVDSAKGPWCYVNAPHRWEYCFVPLCNKDCRTSITDKNYDGTLNVTISGNHCRKWRLTTRPPAGGDLPGYHNETLNYCRTPPGDPETTPWCYTTNASKRWESCNVSLCVDIKSTICPDLIGSDLFIEPLILTGYQYDSVVIFTCKTGYEIEGPKAIRCTVDSQSAIRGHWNATQPKCEGIRCPLITLDHSNVLNRSIRFPETIQVKCNSGYQLNGSISIECTQSGNWSPLPTCDGIECPLITLEHSNVLNRSIRFPEAIQVKCNSGYQLNGSSSIECTQFGNFSLLPTCDGIKCPPITLEHSNVLSRSIRFPETIQVKCNSGYQLNGSSSIQCTQSGNWSPLPTCDGIKCPLITLEHSNVLRRSMRFPDTIQVKCNSGYQLNGSSSIQCTQSGNWSPLPTCDVQAVSCPDLILRPHIVQPIKVSDYRYHDNITFVCDTGYNVVGNITITCTASGQWSGYIPTCDPLSCPVLNIPNMKQPSHPIKYYFKNTVHIQCESGFMLNGPADLKCLATGHWNAQFPVCQYVSCKTNNIPPNVIVLPLKMKYFYNESVTFFCDTEFFGTSVRSTCNIYGQWKPAPSKCSRHGFKSESSNRVFNMVFGVLFGCSLICNAALTGVVIHVKRKLKEATTPYEDIKMSTGSTSNRKPDDVYTELN